ncbi:MAG: Mur ligase family protein [Bacteroidetes bacterium]|nr:Mur ligase family protein [Bacteroidota bacterium]
MSPEFADRLLNLPRYSELGNAAIKPGLQGISMLLEAMGNPHQSFSSVHIAGTNGKGTVASMIASIGQVAGYRMGLYTSPHLLHLSERIRLNGIPVPFQWMESALDRYQDLLDCLQPSFFEAMTALGFLYFAESTVDFAIVETGLGGRLDATNIVQPALSVITNIDLDHTRILGTTLDEITHEKAGIVKKHVPVISATGHDFTQDIVSDVAAQMDAPWIEVGHVEDGFLHTPNHQYEHPTTSEAAPVHYMHNALISARSAELLFPQVHHHPDLVELGLSQVHTLTGLRGRLEILRKTPLTVLDVAHNPAGIAAALDYVTQFGSIHLLLSLMNDKDLGGVAVELARYPSLHMYVCELDLARAYAGAEMANSLQRSGLNVVATGSVPMMWDLVRCHVSEKDVILICGSHYLAEAFLSIYS